MVTSNTYAKQEDLLLVKRDVAILQKDVEEIKGDIRALDYRLTALEHKVDAFYEEFKEFKDSVLKTLDWLVGAFKRFDDEHTILTGQYSTVNEKLENHDMRLCVLEKS